jgi:hypothetical protein
MGERSADHPGADQRNFPSSHEGPLPLKLFVRLPERAPEVSGALNRAAQAGKPMNRQVRQGSSALWHKANMKQALLLAGAAALAFASPALAKPGKGHGNHGKGQSAHVHGGSQFGYGRDGCPPGLAKKNPRCMPPGQYKKLYNVGQRLPFGYRGFTPYDQIPYDLRRHYDLNDDYRYIYRDQYLYRVDPTTMVVQQILNAIL